MKFQYVNGRDEERENGSKDWKICSIKGKVRDREVRNRDRLCSVLRGNFKGTNI